MRATTSRFESDNLVVKGVPYVTADRTVADGILVSELSTSGNTTTTPGTHEIFFVGSIPCDHNGNELTKLLNQRGQLPMAGDLLPAVRSCTSPAVRAATRTTTKR